MRLGSQPRLCRLARGLALGLGLGAGFARPQLASAHGRPATIDALVAADAEGPWLARLSEGLAFRSPEAWHFVCPARFGAEDITLLSAPADGELAYVAGASDIYTITRDGVISAQKAPLLAGNSLLALGTAGVPSEALWGVRYEESGSALLRLGTDGTDVSWSDHVTWQSLAGRGAELWLAAVEDSRLALARLSLDAELKERSSIELPELAFSARLRTAGERTFVLTVDAHGHSLYEVAGNTVKRLLAAQTSIDGPVAAADGALWVVSDGELVRVRDDATESVSAGLRFVGRSPTRAYAGWPTRIVELGDAGLGDTVFDLSDLQPPALAPAESNSSAACADQWAVFQNDLASAAPAGAPVAPTVSESPGARPRNTRAPMSQQVEAEGGGCALVAAPVAVGARGWGLVASVAIFGALRRRSKRR